MILNFFFDNVPSQTASERPYFRLYELEVSDLNGENLSCQPCIGSYSKEGASECIPCGERSFLDMKTVYF